MYKNTKALPQVQQYIDPYACIQRHKFIHIYFDTHTLKQAKKTLRHTEKRYQHMHVQTQRQTYIQVNTYIIIPIHSYKLKNTHIDKHKFTHA